MAVADSWLCYWQQVRTDGVDRLRADSGYSGQIVVAADQAVVVARFDDPPCRRFTHAR